MHAQEKAQTAKVATGKRIQELFEAFFSTVGGFKSYNKDKILRQYCDFHSVQSQKAFIRVERRTAYW
jgi:hypothetical protein